MAQPRFKGLNTRLCSVGFKQPKSKGGLHLRRIETMQQQLIDIEMHQKAKGTGMFPGVIRLFEKKKAILALAKNGVLSSADLEHFIKAGLLGTTEHKVDSEVIQSEAVVLREHVGIWSNIKWTRLLMKSAASGQLTPSRFDKLSASWNPTNKARFLIAYNDLLVAIGKQEGRLHENEQIADFRRKLDWLTRKKASFARGSQFLRKINWGNFKSSDNFYRELEKCGEDFCHWLNYLRADDWRNQRYHDLRPFVAQFAVGGKERIRSPISRYTKNYCLSFGKDFVAREFNEVLKLASKEIRKCSKEIGSVEVES